MTMAAATPSPQQSFGGGLIAAAKPSLSTGTLAMDPRRNLWPFARLQSARANSGTNVRRRAGRRYNIYAAIPYLIGITILAVEAIFIV
jgi:hypothetical protein